MHNKLTLAIDFDGTIVDNAFPEIGKPKRFAFEVLKKLQNEGHRLILWTYRHGKHLKQAVAFCKANGLEFYAINSSFPEEEFNNTASRKILADLFIDDRNLGGLLSWGEIYQEITNKDLSLKDNKKGFLKKWFNL